MVAQFLNNEEIDRDPTNVLQHRLVQRQFCDQTPQAHILLLHLPQVTNLVYSQANQPNVVSSSDKSSAPRSLPIVLETHSTVGLEIPKPVIGGSDKGGAWT